MIFDLRKGFVPEVYSDSRDFRVFLRMIAGLCTVLKYNIDNLPSLYNAYDCPSFMLELLAAMVGYEYDESVSESANRIVIQYFPYLIRNRGSEDGLKLAVALSLNSSDSDNGIYPMEDLIVDYDYENGMITVYFPNTEDIRQNLIEYIRPVGMMVKLVPADLTKPTEELDVKADVKIIKHPYRKHTSEVDTSQVGFSYTDRTKMNNVDE